MKKCQPNETNNPITDYLQNPLNHKASTIYTNSIYLTSSSCNNLRLIWQRDLNCQIDEDTWKQIVADNGKYIKDTRGKFTQYKILHRYYWTPCRLFKVGLISTNTCWNCKTEMGTFIHLIWECSMVNPAKCIEILRGVGRNVLAAIPTSLPYWR